MEKDNVIPSAVGDIHVPNSNIPFDLNYTFSPNAPTTMSSDNGYGTSSVEKGMQDTSPGFLKTVAAEAYEFNSTAEGLHGGYTGMEHPGQPTTLHQAIFDQPDTYSDIAPNGWTPNSQPEMFYDIKPEYNSYLMDSKGPKDLEYRRDRVQSEQEHDNTLANGSTFARIIGGLAGAITDPVSYIPIAGWVKYAKFAPTMLKSAARALPGVTTAGILQAGGREIDKVNANLQDFVIDSAVNSISGLAIFGGLGVGALALDKMELWSLKDISKSYIKGIDFKHVMDEKGEITGIKAFDNTGSLSAAEVSYAQELANSSFEKSGFFKIPYLGDAVLSIKSYPGIGSPLLNMLNSSYQTVRGFIDRAADHSIVTKGQAEGDVKPKSFEFFMKREFADLRSISAQMNALHMKRMGIDIKNRPISDVTQIGLGLYNKSLKVLGKDMDKTGYISRDDFHDEVQQVLTSETPSEHAAVNDAASMIRGKIDTTYKNYLKAYNLPEDIFPPKTAAGYLMRVYNTDYLNVNKDKWVSTISDWLKESDATINDRMQPINELQQQIKDFKSSHDLAFKELGKRQLQLHPSREITYPEEEGISIRDFVEPINKSRETHLIPYSDIYETYNGMNQKLKYLKDTLQNELRSNPELAIHVDNLHALSADESKELTDLLKPKVTLKKQIEKQKSIISDLKNKRSQDLSVAKKSKTVESAKPKAEKHAVSDEKVTNAEDDLHELNIKLQDMEYDLYDKVRNGEINPRLFYPSTHQFKDVNDRLKFRDTYGSDIERQNHAKAYYDSIMHLKPEDIVNDVMGRVTGNSSENHLKRRTLLVPDELLYNNNFMTKDLMAKLANYTLYLSRRTHLKNVYQDITHDGGIEPLVEKLGQEYQTKRLPFDNRKSSISDELKKMDIEIRSKDVSESRKVRIESDKEVLRKEQKELDKKLKDEAKRFDAAKLQMSKSYEKMMGYSNRSRGENLARSVIMSMTAMTNLHFLPATQIADIGAIGLQHGVWPFVRDAVYPALQSLGGILKTKDSEALRKSAPSVHLALQDVLGGVTDKNWSMEAQPYLNLGRVVGGIEKLAQFSANTDLTTFIDNMLQRLTGATVQSEFMRILHDSVKGTMSKKDSEYLRKYGIDPKKWDKRMVSAYEDAGGFKTKLGGYQSRFWSWQDMEASNEFSDAVFRGIQNTIINRGMFDSPFWADNFLGMLFHTFTGWGYASVNRYLVPMLQRPDAQQILGVLFSLGTGSLVSPMRRAARGEDAVPDNMSDGQRFWESINDSDVGSAIATTLDWANLISGDRLLGDLKNDKYRNRMRSGALGPVFSTANRMTSILDALASGEFNQKDASQMARMLPITGTMWGYYMSQMMIDKLGLPPNRSAAQAQ